MDKYWKMAVAVFAFTFLLLGWSVLAETVTITEDDIVWEYTNVWWAPLHNLLFSTIAISGTYTINDGDVIRASVTCPVTKDFAGTTYTVESCTFTRTSPGVMNLHVILPGISWNPDFTLDQCTFGSDTCSYRFFAHVGDVVIDEPMIIEPPPSSLIGTPSFASIVITSLLTDEVLTEVETGQWIRITFKDYINPGDYTVEYEINSGIKSYLTTKSDGTFYPTGTLMTMDAPGFINAKITWYEGYFSINNDNLASALVANTQTLSSETEAIGSTFGGCRTVQYGLFPPPAECLADNQITSYVCENEAWVQSIISCSTVTSPDDLCWGFSPAQGGGAACGPSALPPLPTVDISGITSSFLEGLFGGFGALAEGLGAGLAVSIITILPIILLIVGVVVFIVVIGAVKF